MTLIVDPVLPPDFDFTPNEARSEAELQQWWCQAFAHTLPNGKFEVRCLDGGAWDRSTWYGVVDTVEEAEALADAKLGKWRQTMSRPTMTLLGDGRDALVIYDQRPGSEPRVVFEGTQAECAAWAAVNLPA